MDELDGRRNAMRAPWIAGDQGTLSRALGRTTADDFVGRLGDLHGVRALDLACGAGLATFGLARAGAAAVGVDFAPNLLRQAEDAAAGEGLEIAFNEAFAEELPYPDACFDILISMFGVEFSPFPERVVSEAARVLVGGGRLAFANWTSGGMNGEFRALATRYAPHPGGGAPSFGWGDAVSMRDLLGPRFTSIETRRITTFWESSDGPDQMVRLFVDNAGPLRMLLAGLEPDGRSALLAEMSALFRDRNEAGSSSGGTRIRNEYLDVRAVRPQD